MSLKVLLNGSDITNRVISAKVYKYLSTSKGINPNEAIIVLDNSDGYYTADALPSENTLLEIEYNSVKHFKGYIYRPKLIVKSAKMIINARDFWKIMEKRTLPNVVYLNQRLLDVLKDLINRGGEDPNNLIGDDPDITIPFLHFEKGTRLTDAIKKVLEAVDGFMWYSGDGVLNFRSIFARQNYTGTYQPINIVGEINPNLFENLTFRKLTPECNIATVEIETKSVKDEIETIYFGATEEQPFRVPAGGYPEDSDDRFYIEFDEPVWWMEQYADIEVVADQPNVFVDQGVYESNFLDNIAYPGVLKNPWKIELRIINNSGVDANITKFIIEGKKVSTAHFVASSGSGIPEEEYKLSSDVIGDKDWAKRLADWLLQVKGEKWEMENIKIIDFDKHDIFDVGKKVSVKYDDYNINENALINGLTLDFDRSLIELAVEQLIGETYSYPGGVGGTEEKPSAPGGQGDGASPPAPATITATPGIGLITVSWSSVSPQIYDFSYYELQRSVDGGAWETIINTEGNSYVDKNVSYSSTYKYRVRTWDIEYKSSAFTEMTTTVSPVRAGTDDIADETITANKLNVAVDLSVGRVIKIGDILRMGYDEEEPFAGIKVGTNEEGYLFDSNGLRKLISNQAFEVASIIFQDVLDFDGSTLKKRINLPGKILIDRIKVLTSINSLQNVLQNMLAFTSYEIVPDPADPTLTSQIDIVAGIMDGIKKLVATTAWSYHSLPKRNIAITLNNVSRVEIEYQGVIRLQKNFLFWTDYKDYVGKKMLFSYDYPTIGDFSMKITFDNYSIEDLPGIATKTYLYNIVNYGNGVSQTHVPYVYENDFYTTMNPQPSGYPKEYINVYAYQLNSGAIYPLKALVNVMIFLV